MKMIKKVLSFVCGVVLTALCVFPSFFTVATASAATATGVRFDSDDNYTVQNVISNVPKTVEVEFKITKAELGSAQRFLFGNFGNGGNHTGKASTLFTLRVNANGCPLLYIFQTPAASTNINHYITFGNVQVATGEKVHLAISYDNSNFYCYKNGELAQTVAMGANTSPVDEVNYPMYNDMIIGGNLPKTDGSNTTDHFTGEMYSLSMYSDIRTAAEIRADYNNGTTYTDNALLLGYDFTKATTGQSIFEDLSNHKNNAINAASLWRWSTTPKYDPDDYSYSMMVVGDTQIVSKYSMKGLATGKFTKGNTYMDMIYDYIVDNVETKKVKHVFGLGDVTEYNSKNEWEEAVRVTSKMNGVVPYSIVRGNHDLATSWWTGSSVLGGNQSSWAPYFTYDYTDGTSGTVTYALENGKTVDKTTCDGYYGTYFGTANSAYTSQFAYSYNNSPNTHIQFFTGNDKVEYMVVVLDYGPTDDMLNWASNIISQYPNHNVIVTTHGYMWGEYSMDGATYYGKRYIDSNDGGMSATKGANGSAANDGGEMWNELIKKHSNIKMVLCGHVDVETVEYRKDLNDFGDPVIQMLINPQGIDVYNRQQPLYVADNSDPANMLVGMVATYYFSEDGKNVDVEWYSPIQKAYYREDAQITFTTESTEYPRLTAKVKSGEGTVSPAKVDINGAPVTVTFAPSAGYAIKKVTLNGINVTDQVQNNQLVVTDTANYCGVEVEYYALDKFPISITNNSAKGTASLSVSTSGTYLAGEQVTFSVTPIGDNVVEAVKFNGHTIVAVGGVYTLTIAPVNNIVEVIYADIPDAGDIPEPELYGYTVVNDNTKGTVSLNANASSYQAGQTFTFTVTPIADNTIKAVKVNGHTVVAVGGVYTVTIAPTNNIIEIIYNEPVVAPPADPEYYGYTIVNDNAKGTVSINSYAQEFLPGETFTFTVTPIGANTVKVVKVNGYTVEAVGGVYTVTVASMTNIIEVVYNEIPVNYSLSVVNDTTKGTIVSQTSIGNSYVAGTQISFNVNTIGNNVIDYIKFNGHVVSINGGEYTITIAPTNNVLEIAYKVQAPTGNTFSLEIVNNSAKGSILSQDTILTQYQVGSQVKFFINTEEGNTVKAVKFNGRTITAVGGEYTITIASTDNILEIIYNGDEASSAPALGCNFGSIMSILGIVSLCAVSLFKKF